MPNTPAAIPEIDDWLDRVELESNMDVPRFVREARGLDRIAGTDGYLFRRYKGGGDSAVVALAALRARSVRLARLNEGGMVMPVQTGSPGVIREAPDAITYEHLVAAIEVANTADTPKVGAHKEFMSRQRELAELTKWLERLAPILALVATVVQYRRLKAHPQAVRARTRRSAKWSIVGTAVAFGISGMTTTTVTSRPRHSSGEDGIVMPGRRRTSQVVSLIRAIGLVAISEAVIGDREELSTWRAALVAALSAVAFGVERVLVKGSRLRRGNATGRETDPSIRWQRRSGAES